MIEIINENNKAILADNTNVIILAHSKGCQACTYFMPIYEKVAKEFLA
jgi:hypothetical protein